MIQYQDEELTHKIIAAAIGVHKALGPGLLESAYKTCLLINSNVPLLKKGIRRYALDAREIALGEIPNWAKP